MSRNGVQLGTLRKALEALVALWKKERGRVERYGAEAPLEQAFIQPVLEATGWKLIYQTFLEGRKPDYALFASDDAMDAALRVDRTSPDFWPNAVVVADAKAWHVPLNRPSIVNNQREYPPQQIEWYLDRSRRDFGILTNGALWRLVPRERAAPAPVPDLPRFRLGGTLGGMVPHQFINGARYAPRRVSPLLPVLRPGRVHRKRDTQAARPASAFGQQ